MSEQKGICPIKAEYYPSIPREQIERNCEMKLALRDLSGLGSSFSIIAAAVAEAAMNASSNEGLYRCVFPEGVKGQLAMFKNENAFLEIILSDNYNTDYLNNISEKIKEYTYQYRIDYTEVYNQLIDHAKGSTQKKVLKSMGDFGKIAGNAVAKVPMVNKGLLDEALIAAGKKLEDFSENQVDDIMGNFVENIEIGVQLFLDNIELINQMCNSKVDMLFDKEIIYLCK